MYSLFGKVMRKPNLMLSNFWKVLDTVEVEMSHRFAKLSRKRASLSCTSVRKISSSTVSAVDFVIVVRNVTICKITPHVGNPVYWCVRVSLPQIIVALKGMIVVSLSVVHFRSPDS